MSPTDRLPVCCRSPTYVYGSPPHRQEEGAREVMMFWQEGKTTAEKKVSSGADYRALNKKAAAAGVVSSGEQRKFRREHPATLKIGMLHRKPATVPDGDFVYGRPSSQRTMEEIRRCGKDSSYSIGMLLQGEFADEWTQKHVLMKKLEKPVNVPARPTKASLGHHLGALDAIQKVQERSQNATHLFKMPRFQKVLCKISTTR